MNKNTNISQNKNETQILYRAVLYSEEFTSFFNAILHLNDLANIYKNLCVYFEIFGYLVLVQEHPPCFRCKRASRRLHRSANVSKSGSGAKKNSQTIVNVNDR